MLKHSGSQHIPDSDLIRIADGELSAKAVSATETHLRSCSHCRARLDELKRGADSYDQYHAQVLRPSVELPEAWSSVAARLRKLDETTRKPVFPAVAMWWGVAAALVCCCFVVTWSLYRQSPIRRMQQLLTRAAVATTPRHRRVEVILNGRTWYRPATLEGETAHRPSTDERGLEETQAQFVKASYNWDDPLSVRSFAAWRKNLPSRRDRVFSVQDGPEKGRFYRLETETAAGVLRMAALTLRADTLSPVKGAFHFEQQNDVTIEDAGEMPEPSGKLEAQNRPQTQNRPLPEPSLVKEVGAVEELRVFAALNAIGADVGESVSVDIAPSKQQVIVAGVGLSRDREQQIRQAVAGMPNTEARFTSGQASAFVNRPPDTATSANAINDTLLRQTLEKQAGGAQPFQTIADKALDASSTILQRAHALYVLAERFPPFIASHFDASQQDVLRFLRRRHAIVIEQATADLKSSLRPLLHGTAGVDETQTPRDTSWEVGAAQLYEEAKGFDASLGRILGGTYSQEAGQRFWSKLPDEIQRLEALAISQEKAP